MENAKKHHEQQLKAAAEEASAKFSTASAADRSPSPAIAVVAVKPAVADGDVKEGDDPSPSGGKKVFSRLGPKLTVSDRLGSPVASTAAESKPASKHR